MATNQQLQFDWSGSAANDPSSVLKQACLPEVSNEQPKELLEMAAPDNAAAYIELPWDFATTFPDPLPQALEAGKLGEEDVSAEQIASIHEEHAREYEGHLAHLDEIEEAKRTGINPKTGTRPRTEKTREQLRRYLETAPREIQQTLDALMDIYEDAFGAEAAAAFRKAIESRHAGLEVAASLPAQSLCRSDQHLTSDDLISSGLSAVAVAVPLDRGEATDDDSARCRNNRSDSQKDDADGPPFARPLQSAIDAKVFGEDDFGEPIDPSDEEVESFAVVTAERMTEGLEALRHVEEQLGTAREPARRSQLLREKDQAWSKYHAALGLYVEDFGEQAGRILESWVKGRGTSDEPLYSKGHPWHYYREGDGRRPIPEEDIGPADQDASFLGKLPKDRLKRQAKLEQVLREQTEQLKQDRERYRQLVEHGAESLSAYDRNIAHGGNDELAWASAVALKYNHIRNGLGRVATIQELLRS